MLSRLSWKIQESLEDRVERIVKELGYSKSDANRFLFYLSNINIVNYDKMIG